MRMNMGMRWTSLFAIFALFLSFVLVMPMGVEATGAVPQANHPFVLRADGADPSEDQGFDTLGKAVAAFNNDLTERNFTLFLSRNYELAANESITVKLQGRSLIFQSAENQGPFVLTGNHLTRQLIVNSDGGTFKLANITFDGGSGNNRCGGLLINGPVNVIVEAGTIFQNLEAPDNENQGAALAIKTETGESTVSIKQGASFISNKSRRGDGGALALSGKVSATITGASFEDNEAGSSGGAIYADVETTLNLVDVTFKNNRASLGSSGDGGAVYARGQLTVKGGSFSENKAYKGAAVSVSKQAKITDAFFDNNGASSMGGAIYSYDNVPLTVVGGTYKSNRATGNGGAIYASGPNSIISGAVFEDNQSKYGLGGAVYYIQSENGKLTIKGQSQFTGNKAPSGGAVAGDKGQIEVKGANFNSNAAQLYKNFGGAGGAIFVMNCKKLDVTAEFKQNTATYYGGAIYSAAVPVTIKDSTFKANSTDFMGGAIYLQDNPDNPVVSELSGSTFEANSAAYGGALGTYHTLTISDCKFLKNEAVDKSPGYGGAIYAQGKTTVNSSQFSENTANYGGAVCLMSEGQFGEDTSFIKNVAKFFGGAIWVYPGSTSNPAGLNDYRLLTTAESTNFSGNKSQKWYAPPSNADEFTKLQFASTSSPDPNLLKTLKPHILNDYDVNYQGSVLITYDGTYLAKVKGEAYIVYQQSAAKAVQHTIKAIDDQELKKVGFESTKQMTFKGWNSKADGSGDPYEPGAKIAVDDNLTVYALWQCEVTFDPNGGTPSSKTTIQVDAGQAIDKDQIPADPQMKDKVFLGWFLGDTLWDFSQAVEGPMTLVAKYALEPQDDNTLSPRRYVYNPNLHYQPAQGNTQVVVSNQQGDQGQPQQAEKPAKSSLPATGAVDMSMPALLLFALAAVLLRAKHR